MLRRIAPLLALVWLPSVALGQGDPLKPTSRDTVPMSLPTIEVTGVAGSSYLTRQTTTATKTDTPLRDVPQSVTVISKNVIADQRMQSMADVTRYTPGLTMGQGEGNRDQPTIRGNSTTAGFFVNGMRDDVQYFRDLYNVERVEALKGANALIFGRGVGGGVLNRVTKSAGWTPTRELSLQGGSYGNKRGALDVGQGVSDAIALRLNAVYENSDLYRNDVSVERYGINPTATFQLTPRTQVLASYEHFKDDRTADRGIPSFAGAPLSTATPRTFFGDPTLSYSDALVHIGTATIEHTTGSRVTIRNRSMFADYDKIYQNVFPGAVNDAGNEVSISAYNNTTERQNLLNETEISYRLVTGAISQTLLGGIALGSQITDNFRNTGYFNDTATSITTPVSDPTIAVPVSFRQSATDADNHSSATSVSLYGQSQIVLSSHWQAIVGARYERFDVDFYNLRTGEALSRKDNLVSPRAALLYKPAEAVTLYSSYSVSALPSSGDQFSSLNVTTETLEPEKFTNYELGVKWDILNRLSVAAATYRLDRTNTTAPDPSDPTKTLQTGSQRTKGFELSVTGALTPEWEIIGGYANQDATITSLTAAAAPGAKVPLVPRNTVSLWNRYQPTPALGLGLGVIYQDDMYAAIDDAVTLPSFTRFDAAAYYGVSHYMRFQVNLENLFDQEYFATAHSNNNITPGSPRSVRVAVVTGF
ncbi:MAG TPA: TonB-dependent siderophore receptor [Gemmatimonadales bacterium]|nr:TonB-dependent siderophore receptor [Gemmatimonadales bacterium]